ncbi:hypothetical protein Hypma_002708 [Hypsizygus marmoreus]|uniref:Uncharacterized protein n=1 Tax=Hypsizygus marmoreus TaxID=39966 RepID=A0A369J7Y7_HYPMA|nr:hypothetical protein Hypma_002708 [Hypsizygus marmoreus]
MKLSFSKSFLFFCGFSIVSLLAMPMYYASRAVAARSPPTIDAVSPRDAFVAIELEARQGQAGAAIDIASQAAGAIGDIVGVIKAGIQADKDKRTHFTQDVIDQLNTKDPTLNYIMCHVKHSTAFDGEKGTDWGHSHQELDIDLGGTIGYEIYWAKSGTFTREGDGGYINWAYVGNVVSKSADGKVLVFGPR